MSIAMGVRFSVPLFFSALAFAGFSGVAHAFTGSGAGTSGSPYLITTCDQLQEMNDAKSAYYSLSNDIDCSATTGWNSGAGFVPVGTSASPFTGNLNGNSYAISNLFINRTTTNNVGLIGYGNGATIQYLTLTNGDVTGSQGVGMLAGYLRGNSLVQHIVYSGTTTATSFIVGGLIGEMLGATLKYATSTDIRTVNTQGSCCSYAGGIVGYSGTATISDIYASSTVISTNSGRAGGFFGETSGRGGTGVTISRVYGQVAVTSPASGGFISFAYGSSGVPLTITDAGVRGVAGGSSAAGGFAYTTYSNVTFTNVYSAVVVTSNSKGGFQNGVTNTPTITASYWNSQIAGTANATASGSLAGQGITATTTAAMQTQSTYSGWDFSSVWGIAGGVNGGYPYLQMLGPDTTAPSVSLTLPDDGTTIYGSAIALSATASDNRAIAGVRFYVNNVAVGSEDTSSPYSIVWNSLSATSSGTKTVFAVARDTSNNYATSTSRTVTLANQPSPSSLSYSAATNTATVAWSTPVEGSSRMFFGFTSALASSTPEQNTGTRVTSHSVNLSGLPPCAVFRYQTVSTNESSEVATSSQSTFSTSGCSGSASILANSEDDITAASGGTLTQGVLSLTVPASFTSTSSQATFQAKRLDGSTFFSSISAPTGRTRATTTVYTLSAYTDTTTALSSFTQPVTITFSYSDDDVSGLDESSLRIYRYDGSEWAALSSCTVDTSANTVSCETTQFSDFGIFGEEPSVGSNNAGSSAGGGNGPIFAGPPSALPNYRPPQPQIMYPDGRIVYLEESRTSMEEQENGPPINAPVRPVVELFTRTLRAGSVGEDVRELQKFLNARGFVLAVRGNGAPGEETNYFGPMTYNALVKFQEAHAQDILFPLGISKGTGIFAGSSRAFVNALIAN